MPSVRIDSRLRLSPPNCTSSFASADYRLGEFDAFTVGLKYGRMTRSGNEWSTRVEFYSADGTVPGNLLVGNQGGREIYPDLDAIIAQFSYHFDW